MRRMQGSLRACWWGVLALWGCAAPAQTNLLPIAQEYVVRRWGVEDGLPEGIVNGIEQFPDGFLWLTMPHGVARFDGVRFESLPPEVGPAPRPGAWRGLTLGRQDEVWLYGSDGVMRRDGQGWGDIPLQPGPAAFRGPPQLRETPDGAQWIPAGLELFWVRVGTDGAVWAAANVGVFRFDGRLLRLIPRRAPDTSGPPPPDEFRAAAMDTRGDIWLAGREGLCVFDGRAYRPRPGPPAMNAQRIFQLFAGADGAVWARFLEGKTFRCLQGVWTEVPPAGLRFTALQEDAEGETWIGAVEGLYRRKRGQWDLLTDYIYGRPWNVRCLKQTPDGSLWVGTGDGLYQLRRRAVHMGTGRQFQWVVCVTSLASGPNGELFVGIINGGLMAGQPTEVLHPVDIGRPYFSSIAASALLRSSRGELWAGFQGDHLWRVATNGVSRQFRSREGTASRGITCLLEDRTGQIWVGTQEGVMFPRDKWLDQLPGPMDTILALAEDAQGRIWAGTQSSGLWQIATNGVLRTLHKSEGLPSETVRLLHADAEGVLWMGTPAGLVRWATRPRQPAAPPFTFTRAHGLPEDDIRQLLDDTQGHLWVGARRTILRVRKAELAAVAAGNPTVLKVRSFGAEDGLTADLSGGDHGPLAVRTEEGRLWFATRAGVAMIDPRQMPPDPPLAPVYITDLRADGRACWARPLDGQSATRAQPHANLALPPGSRDIALRFTSPAYASPERMLFRTWLEGYDTAWSAPTTERLVSYPRLPPGAYRFRVMASSPAGGWREAEAGVAFSVLPPFWQTWWFVSAGVLGLAAGAGSGGAWLVRRRARRKWLLAEQKRASERMVELERARIARDVHDEIGAGLTEVGMLGEWLRQDVAAGLPAASAAKLDRLCEAARELTRSTDEIVWAVNPANDTLKSFLGYAGQYVEQFLTAAGLRYRLDVPAEIPAWTLSSRVRHHLFMGLREALANVVRHAHAELVHFRVAFEGLTLRLTLEDDGRGFEQAQRPGSALGHDGLASMEARMREIGGQLTLRSAPGQGTVVEIAVPFEALGWTQAAEKGAGS